MDPAQSFGRWLKQRRKRLGFTQAQLGTLTQYAGETIRKVESGDLRPSRQMAEKLAEALKIPPAEWEFFIGFARERSPGIEPPKLSPPPAITLPSTQSGYAASLPTELTSFIGREQEIAVVQRLLLREAVRLVTLTGPPGIGKTRLALQVVNKLRAYYPDGVAYINLTPITDPSLLVITIAQMLDVRETAGQPLLDTLKNTLRDQQRLLLLDNFEQIVSAAPLLATLLAAAPKLKMLVTSQIMLNLRSEHVFTVPALAQPDLNHLSARGTELIATLGAYEAVQLFVERAQAKKLNFVLTSTNAPIIAEICHLLDGLPLAIELAAAHIPYSPLQSIREALSITRLKLFKGTAQDETERHRTLRAAIDWSYSLLSADEKKLFRRLAVFVGGFTLHAAQMICNAGSDLGIDVFDGLTSLINRSLMWQAETRANEPRYWQLATIREYGLERLAESDEAKAMQNHHAHFFLQLVEEGEVKFMGAEEAVWLDQLQADHDNLRAALAWCLRLDADPEPALRLAGSLGAFWEVYGYLSEGRAYLMRALSHRAADRVTAARAKALNSVGVLAELQGDIATAYVYYEESLAIRRHLGDKNGVSAALNNLGKILLEQNDAVGARTAYEESLAIRREIGNKGGIAISLNDLGEMARFQRDYEHATQLYTESLHLFRELTNKRGVAWVLHNLGYVSRYQGATAQAALLFTESLNLFQDLGYTVGVTACLTGLASIIAAQGNVEQAVQLLGAAEALRKSLGMQMGRADRAEYERDVANIRAYRDPATFEANWDIGQAMTLEQAVSLALALCP